MSQVFKESERDFQGWPNEYLKATPKNIAVRNKETALRALTEHAGQINRRGHSV
jgi:hypothetical protein